MEILGKEWVLLLAGLYTGNKFYSYKDITNCRIITGTGLGTWHAGEQISTGIWVVSHYAKKIDVTAVIYSTQRGLSLIYVLETQNVSQLASPILLHCSKTVTKRVAQNTKVWLETSAWTEGHSMPTCSPVSVDVPSKRWIYGINE